MELLFAFELRLEEALQELAHHINLGAAGAVAVLSKGVMRLGGNPDGLLGIGAHGDSKNVGFR